VGLKIYPPPGFLEEQRWVFSRGGFLKIYLPSDLEEQRWV